MLACSLGGARACAHQFHATNLSVWSISLCDVSTTWQCICDTAISHIYSSDPSNLSGAGSVLDVLRADPVLATLVVVIC